MISVTDLLKWADEHAIGRSPSYPRGWISGKDLQMLSAQVEQNEPLNFYYSVRSNAAAFDWHRLGGDDCTFECKKEEV